MRKQNQFESVTEKESAKIQGGATSVDVTREGWTLVHIGWIANNFQSNDPHCDAPTATIALKS